MAGDGPRLTLTRPVIQLDQHTPGCRNVVFFLPFQGANWT
jgi:hypothetical protein